MVAEQVYSLINDVAGDALGKNAITVRSTADLVSLGEVVLSSSTDAFYNALMDRISKVYIKARRYAADINDGIVMTPINFGAILQKIQAGDLDEAVSNPSWSSSNTKMYYEDKDSTDIIQTLYSKIATWAVKEKVIYDHQLNSAFTSAADFGAFVNLIYNDMYNAMEVHLEETGRLAIATGIAQCIKSTNNAVKRNLLAEYKTIHSDSTLTSATCLYDADFLRYASREINLVVNRMSRMSKIFNPNKKTRFTPKEDLVAQILADFTTACDSYLMSDTYHNELVALPLYKAVPYWQGSGTSFDFADTSKISIVDEAQEGAAEEGEDPENTTQSGIIAYIHDRDAVGMMIDRIRTKSLYDPMNERTHTQMKADVGFYCDPNENGVVFYVAD